MVSFAHQILCVVVGRFRIFLSCTMSISVPKSQPGGAMLRGVVSVENPELDAFPVDFKAFRDAAAQTMHQDSSTLLLYLLVHRNTHFQAFLLQNQNYEKLVSLLVSKYVLFVLTIE